MAPSVQIAQSLSSKIKRPVPPGIQTNGINSSTSSPSPSMSASRLPSAAKFPPNSATSNGVGNNSAVRSANRNRREAPPQLLGRGQRNSSVGLRSACIAGESSLTQVTERQPYVKSDDYILKKYRGHPPSLIIHLHPTHFRFDQQDGNFTYKSPMKIVLEHLKLRTIPHDLVEHFSDIPYYEGCMIVQVHDHKSTAPAQGPNRKVPGAEKTTPFSVHNYNAYLTPSSYVPYHHEQIPTERGKVSADDGGDSGKGKSIKQMDKENMPAPTLPNDNHRNRNGTLPRKPKIHTIVLHPTPLSIYVELASKASDPRSGTDSRRDSRQDSIIIPLSATVPPTPSTAIPSTPQTSMAPPAKRVKKARVELDSNNIHAFEAQATLATTAPLVLEPVSSARECSALLESLSHPMHSEKPPSPKTRKRTVAEMAADEALAAEQERYMLIFDERLSSNTASGQGGANAIDGDGQAGGASFEPRFERFKTLENIKNQHEENKKIEKLRREEQERKQQQDRERNKLRDEAKERDQEKMRAMQMQQQAARQQQQHQEAQRRAQQAQQSQQAMQGVSAQAHVPHAHPQANNIAANGVPAQSQRFHQQQVSQAQTSSPIVRNGTPQSHSSPTVNGMGNVPMQHSTSSLGGSPPRPGSVVQQSHPQMGATSGHGMTTQRSQQSHAGTPRMPSSTPGVQSTPLNRTMSQTPRMSQGSPLQGPMAQGPHIPMMNGQPMPMNAQQQQQLLAQQQQQQQQRMAMMRNQQVAGQSMGGMISHQMSPQQLMQAQAQAQFMRQQQQQNQQSNPSQVAYAAQMAAMARGQGAVPPNINQNFMGNPGMGNIQGMNLSQLQQMQQMQQMQQIRAVQAQAHAQAQAPAAHQQQLQTQQQQQHPQQMSVNPQQQQMFQQQVMQLAGQFYNQQKQSLMQTYPNGLPDELDRQLKQKAQQQAATQIKMRRQQQMMASGLQMSGMQMNAMQMNGMQSGMPNGMGM